MNEVDYFYEAKPSGKLRFGDVIKGCISYTTSIDKINELDFNKNYKINVNLTNYSVVLTPCCTIDNKDKLLVITPLTKVKNSFYKNPYFFENLTNINRVMEPSKTVAPNVWERLPEVEKIKRLEEGNVYGLLEYFIYPQNDYFTEYEVSMKDMKNFSTKYYMIDFKQCYKVRCENINKVWNLKVLELTIKARGELRDKIAYYYGRPPKEDLILED